MYKSLTIFRFAKYLHHIYITLLCSLIVSQKKNIVKQKPNLISKQENIGFEHFDLQAAYSPWTEGEKVYERWAVQTPAAIAKFGRPNALAVRVAEA